MALWGDFLSAVVKPRRDLIHVLHPGVVCPLDREVVLVRGGRRTQPAVRSVGEQGLVPAVPLEHVAALLRTLATGCARFPVKRVEDTGLLRPRAFLAPKRLNTNGVSNGQTGGKEQGRALGTLRNASGISSAGNSGSSGTKSRDPRGFFFFERASSTWGGCASGLLLNRALRLERPRLEGSTMKHA